MGRECGGRPRPSPQPCRDGPGRLRTRPHHRQRGDAGLRGPLRRADRGHRVPRRPPHPGVRARPRPARRRRPVLAAADAAGPLRKILELRRRLPRPSSNARLPVRANPGSGGGGSEAAAGPGVRPGSGLAPPRATKSLGRSPALPQERTSDSPCPRSLRPRPAVSGLTAGVGAPYFGQDRCSPRSPPSYLRPEGQP